MAEQNAFKKLNTDMHRAVRYAMEDTGEAMALRMKLNLTDAGHIDTGALRDSIRSETRDEGDKIVTYIYADAKSPEGTQYAEFIELGTGEAHGRAGGRSGYWRYKDRNGIWHTTNGMDADPFIEPAVQDFLPRINEFISDAIYNIAKYNGGGE